MLSNGLKKTFVEKDWIFWTIFIIVQIGTLINLAILPYLPIFPLISILLLILITSYYFPKVLLTLIVISILASEELYFELGLVVVRIIDIILLITILYMFMKWLLQSKMKIESLPIFKFALGLIILMAFISLIGTLSVSNSLFEILQIIELVIAAILFFNLIKTESDIKLVLSTILIYSIVDALWIFIQYWHGDLIGRHIGLFGTLANELSYGVALSVGFFYLIRKKWLRFAILMSGAFQISAIYLTKGRGLFITAIIMALVCSLLFAMYRRRYLSFVYIAAMILIACLVSFWVFSSEIQARYTSIIEGGQMRDLRLIYWAVALKVWQNYPLFGVGVGNIKLASVQFTPKPFGLAFVALGQGMESPHNEYLSFAMQAGWIGFISGIIFYMILLWNSIRLYLKSRFQNKEYSVLLLSFVIGLIIWNIANDVLLAGKGILVMLFISILSRMHAIHEDYRI
ncbi:MAG: O-antigen ligase family protein [bacterium]